MLSNGTQSHCNRNVKSNMKNPPIKNGSIRLHSLRLILYCHAKELDKSNFICHIQAAALTMDESILDADQVENLIKFCPTKEEMELLKVKLLFTY